MNNDNMTAKPVSDKEYHLYVTIESARKASTELAALINRKWKEENINNRKSLVSEIIDTYIPFAKPTNGEKDKVALTDFVTLKYGEGDMARYYDLNLANIHAPIKPVSATINLSLTHILALNEIDRESVEIKEREEKLSDDIFRNIVYLREKDCIDQVFPEVMELLQFEPFVYNTPYLREIVKKEVNK